MWTLRACYRVLLVSLKIMLQEQSALEARINKYKLGDTNVAAERLEKPMYDLGRQTDYFENQSGCSNISNDEVPEKCGERWDMTKHKTFFSHELWLKSVHIESVHRVSCAQLQNRKPMSTWESNKFSTVSWQSVSCWKYIVLVSSVTPVFDVSDRIPKSRNIDVLDSRIIPMKRIMLNGCCSLGHESLQCLQGPFSAIEGTEKTQSGIEKNLIHYCSEVFFMK